MRVCEAWIYLLITENLHSLLKSHYKRHKAECNDI